jgi:hypothetical protein
VAVGATEEVHGDSQRYSAVFTPSTTVGVTSGFPPGTSATSLAVQVAKIVDASASGAVVEVVDVEVEEVEVDEVEVDDVLVLVELVLDELELEEDELELLDEEPLPATTSVVARTTDPLVVHVWVAVTPPLDARATSPTL